MICGSREAGEGQGHARECSSELCKLNTWGVVYRRQNLEMRNTCEGPEQKEKAKQIRGGCKEQERRKKSQKYMKTAHESIRS